MTLIANWIPFEEPAGGPNFYPFSSDAYYDINIDNDGDAKADITYRWVFSRPRQEHRDTFLYNTGQVTSLSDPDLNVHPDVRPAPDHLDRDEHDPDRRSGGAVQRRCGLHAQLHPDCATGPSRTLPAQIKSWAGQADDSFFLDLRVFDLLYGADLSEAGDDTLSGFNVNSVALRVPKTELAKHGDGSNNVGVWTTTERPSVRVQDPDGTQSYSGDLVQVSRLGMPLVNEVVIPVGMKDKFNASRPSDDAAVPVQRDRPRGAAPDRLAVRDPGPEPPRATTWRRSS